MQSSVLVLTTTCIAFQISFQWSNCSSQRLRTARSHSIVKPRIPSYYFLSLILVRGLACALFAPFLPFSAPCPRGISNFTTSSKSESSESEADLKADSAAAPWLGLSRLFISERSTSHTTALSSPSLALVSTESAMTNINGPSFVEGSFILISQVATRYVLQSNRSTIVWTLG